MPVTQKKNAQIKDGTLTCEKLAADFLGGNDKNVTGGNNNATFTGLRDGTANTDAVTVQQLQAAVAGIAGVKRLRGDLAGNADLTGNATGNAYADGSAGYLIGDVFDITSDGTITLSGGATIDVNNGDQIVVKNDVGDGAITLADIYKVDNTEATDILRNGNIEDSLTSSSALDVLSANQGLVLKGLIDALNRFEKEEFAVTTNGQVFTLANAPLAGLKNLDVFYNGDIISSSEFTITGTSLTVTSPAPVEAGDCIVVKYRY